MKIENIKFKAIRLDNCEFVECMNIWNNRMYEE